MDTLKKFFPYSFGIKDTSNFVVKIIVYAVASIILGAIVGVLAWLVGLTPAVGGILSWVVGTLGSLVSLYCFAGIVILVLVFTKVLK